MPALSDGKTGPCHYGFGVPVGYVRRQYYLAEKTHVISPSMNVFLITGFCGGYTTFSSFADDMYLLLQQKHWLYFGLYVGLSFILGLVLVWLGRSLIKAV